MKMKKETKEWNLTNEKKKVWDEINITLQILQERLNKLDEEYDNKLKEKRNKFFRENGYTTIILPELDEIIDKLSGKELL